MSKKLFVENPHLLFSILIWRKEQQNDDDDNNMNKNSNKVQQICHWIHLLYCWTLYLQINYLQHIRFTVFDVFKCNDGRPSLIYMYIQVHPKVTYQILILPYTAHSPHALRYIWKLAYFTFYMLTMIISLSHPSSI